MIRSHTPSLDTQTLQQPDASVAEVLGVRKLLMIKFGCMQTPQWPDLITAWWKVSPTHVKSLKNLICPQQQHSHEFPQLKHAVKVCVVVLKNWEAQNLTAHALGIARLTIFGSPRYEFFLHARHF
jgi:hypothetical protein